ncbi:MAG: contact-dependent growth inhibition system immunity protein [Gallionellaceae bacterium]|nr:contact-dependent growth inhibition system immunity protein [Gallionellaceae bacterium]MDD5366496.1 contact-dependent growth inhibition system immunity protein [Gallionellaceae bacterium]
MQGTSRTPGPVGMEASFSPGLDFGQLDEGLELVLTPLQLAAIFNDETIKNEVPLRKDFGGRQRTVEEIVSVYKKSARPTEIGAVQADIASFLADQPNIAASRFDEMFDLEVDPLGFAPSVEEFLLSIVRALSTNQQCLN